MEVIGILRVRKSWISIILARFIPLSIYKNGFCVSSRCFIYSCGLLFRVSNFETIVEILLDRLNEIFVFSCLLNGFEVNSRNCLESVISLVDVTLNVCANLMVRKSRNRNGFLFIVNVILLMRVLNMVLNWLRCLNVCHCIISRRNHCNFRNLHVTIATEIQKVVL